MLYLKTNILPEVVLTSQSHTPSTSAATWIQWVCMCVYINIYSELYNSWLVVSTPLKNMKVNGKDYPIYYGK